MPALILNFDTNIIKRQNTDMVKTYGGNKHRHITMIAVWTLSYNVDRTSFSTSNIVTLNRGGKSAGCVVQRDSALSHFWHLVIFGQYTLVGRQKGIAESGECALQDLNLVSLPQVGRHSPKGHTLLKCANK